MWLFVWNVICDARHAQRAYLRTSSRALLFSAFKCFICMCQFLFVDTTYVRPTSSDIVQQESPQRRHVEMKSNRIRNSTASTSTYGPLVGSAFASRCSRSNCHSVCHSRFAFSIGVVVVVVRGYSWMASRLNWLASIVSLWPRLGMPASTTQNDCLMRHYCDRVPLLWPGIESICHNDLDNCPINSRLFADL